MNDQSMQDLDGKRVKVLKDMPFAKAGDILILDNALQLRGKGEWHFGRIEVARMILNGWLEEINNESLLSKFMDSRTFLHAESAEEFAKIANEHYEKEVVDAMNKATNGIPIPILPIQRGHLVPMDEVLKIINRIKESVADVFKDKE